MAAAIQKWVDRVGYVSLARRRRAETKLFDRLSELLVADPCISVPEFDGVFLLDSRSALFRRVVSKGTYEPQLTELCREHIDPARDAVDIGANIGFHSVLFAKLLASSRVLAVEPTSAAVDRLRSNLIMNQVDDRVLVWQGAASDVTGTATLTVVPGREEFSTLGQLAHRAVRDGFERATERVDTATVDELVERNGLDVGFMKIDVEGFELSVLRGASHVLSKHRPVVILELCEPMLRTAGASARQVIELMQSRGYAVADVADPSAEPGARAYGEVICRPD